MALWVLRVTAVLNIMVVGKAPPPRVWHQAEGLGNAGANRGTVGLGKFERKRLGLTR